MVQPTPMPDGSDVLTPIVPVTIGDDWQAVLFWKALYDEGVYANVALYPAVQRGGALLRTSVMATHEREHLDRALAAFAGGAVAAGRRRRSAPAASPRSLTTPEACGAFATGCARRTAGASTPAPAWRAVATSQLMSVLMPPSPPSVSEHLQERRGAAERVGHRVPAGQRPRRGQLPVHEREQSVPWGSGRSSSCARRPIAGLSSFLLPGW